MKPTKVLVLALVVLLGAQMGATALKLQLEVLVLTGAGDANSNDFITTVMQGYGIRSSVVRIGPNDSPRVNMTELLWAQDGTARYAGFVMYPNIEALGHLNKAEVEALWDYQRRAGARSVKFGAWPLSVGLEVSDQSCGATDVQMGFTDAAPLGASGIKPTAKLGTLGLYRCPGLKDKKLPTCSMWASDFAASGLHPNCQSTPFLEFQSEPPMVGGTLVQYADGRESMAFMLDCSSFSTTCMALGHLAVSWMLRDIIPGERRALLTVQLDDFLLTTYFDAAHPGPAGEKEYRTSVADIKAHIAWMKQFNAALPPGSNVKLELPFNGNGILDYLVSHISGSVTAQPVVADDRSCIDMEAYAANNCSCWGVGTNACPLDQPEFCRNCTKDWAKPLGAGTNRVPDNAANLTSSWNAAEFRRGDPIAAMILDNTECLNEAFFYSHHTFTHQNLDNATTFDTDVQIGLNIEMAAFLGLNKRPTFSSKCMVTPQISGLRNGDALASLVRHGITCGTGDNSWPFLMNKQNPYHMLRTTTAVNGYDGFSILPRFATEIYYNCSTPEQNMALYNHLYEAYFGAPSTVDDLMQREAARVVREGLLRLRHDPYMMHQANLAILDGSGKSLAMRWFDAVLEEFGRYASWPVASLSLDDLLAAFEARQARDACELSYTLDVDAASGAVRAVKVSSAAAGLGRCSAPLMSAGVEGNTTAAIGPSTIQIPVSKGGFAFVELEGLKWAPLSAAAEVAAAKQQAV